MAAELVANPDHVVVVSKTESGRCSGRRVIRSLTEVNGHASQYDSRATLKKVNGIGRSIVRCA